MSNNEDKNSRIRLIVPEDNDKAEILPEKSESSLTVGLCFGLFFLFCLSLVFTTPLQLWHFTPAYFFESITSRFTQLYEFITGRSSTFGPTLFQYLAVVLTGAALAACGTVFQGGFRNVLAGPSTMGVMAGGSLGLLLYLLFVPAASETWSSHSFMAMYGQQLVTLLGCFAGVAIVLTVATIAGRGRLSASAMIVSGTVLSACIGNAGQLIQYYLIMNDPSDIRIESIRMLMLGSFARIVSWQQVLMMAVPILICLAVLLRLRFRLEALSLDDEEAFSMGVDIRRLRNTMVVIGTVLTAVVVAFCGHIGFLGFMIPLIGRRLIGPQMAKLLPVSMLVGAIVLILIYDIAYMAGMQDSLNIFTSAIGGFVLLFALMKKGGASRGA